MKYNLPSTSSLTRVPLRGMLGTLLLMLAACGGDSIVSDEPEQPGTLEKPISFGSSAMTPQPNTRANLEDKGVTSFYAWSYKTKTYDKDTKNYGDMQTIMEQYKVQWTSNTAGSTVSNVADWEYVGITDHGQTQNVKYWDMDATSYRFFGIAPASTSDISYGKNAKGDEYDITFHADAADPETAPYISKLWISNNNPIEFPSHRYGNTVVMEFMKPVTKVRVLLMDENGEPITDPANAGISSLSFQPTGGADIVQSGTLKVSYPLQGTITFTQYLPSLTIIGDTSGSLRIDRLGAITDGEANDYADWYYVLPHILQNAFQLILTVYDKPRLATVPAELMSWNPNMEYTYKFKLTATEVQFIDIVQIGVTSWKTESSQHDIYNW